MSALTDHLGHVIAQHRTTTYSGQDWQLRGRHTCTCGYLLPRAQAGSPALHEAFRAHVLVQQAMAVNRWLECDEVRTAIATALAELTGVTDAAIAAIRSLTEAP